MVMHKTSISSMMVPNLNLVVFYHQTTMWSCLSGTVCSHVVAKPAHVLELAIVVHFLRISQRYLVDLCYNSSFQTCRVWDILTPTRSESQADMMVVTFPKNCNIGLSVTGEVDIVANTPSRKTYYCSILIEEVGHRPIRIS